MKFNILIALLLLSACGVVEEEKAAEIANWQLLPFVKADAANPVLEPNAAASFFCPLREEVVLWEEKDVFNPSAVVRSGKIHLLYRAEDTVGKHAGTSRLGLAMSEDGLHFQRLPEPVFYPATDDMKPYEWEGGIEDPRLVEDENGRYWLTYTAYDGQTARLCVASSADLLSWEKHGLAFAKNKTDKHADLWSKSGAIVTEQKGERFVAKKIKGQYWMYWGDTDIFLATSDDLMEWQPLENEDGSLRSIFGPRPGKFDSDLVEPGPQAMLTEQGILLIYNSRNKLPAGDPQLADGNYAAGQILLDADEPTKVLARSEDYFITPDKDYEITGQINNVCFVEGLVYFKGKWFLYYGTADSKIAVAVKG